MKGEIKVQYDKEKAVEFFIRSAYLLMSKI